MDPFMNQGDQLDQGGKVEVENCWWKFFNTKIRPNKNTRPQRSNDEKMENFEVEKFGWKIFAVKYLPLKNIHPRTIFTP